jgi:hypothetical protein
MLIYLVSNHVGRFKMAGPSCLLRTTTLFFAEDDAAQTKFEATKSPQFEDLDASLGIKLVPLPNATRRYDIASYNIVSYSIRKLLVHYKKL